MPSSFRFGDYQHKLGASRDTISFNRFFPKLEKDAQGKIIPRKRPLIKLKPVEKYRLLRPYISVRIMEQVKAVVPLAVYMILFQIIILRQFSADYWIMTGGLFAVISD